MLIKHNNTMYHAIFFLGSISCIDDDMQLTLISINKLQLMQKNVQQKICLDIFLRVPCESPACKKVVLKYWVNNSVEYITYMDSGYLFAPQIC